MWVSGKTTIAGQGFTTSCTPGATNTYGLPAACSIVLPDGGMYQLSITRTSNGTGTLQVTATSGMGTPG